MQVLMIWNNWTDKTRIFLGEATEAEILRLIKIHGIIGNHDDYDGSVSAIFDWVDTRFIGRCQDVTNIKPLQFGVPTVVINTGYVR